MAGFDWGALPAALRRDVAVELGLPPGRAAQSLSDAFADGPTDDLVRRLWPVLRDSWVGRDPDVRVRVVAELRARRLGDTGIAVGSAAGQKAYLASCRNSRGLREVVTAELGRAASEGHAAPTPSVHLSEPRHGAASAPVMPKVDAAWQGFERALATFIGELHEGDRVVVAFDPVAPAGSQESAYYVQLAADDDKDDDEHRLTLHLEAVSNSYLPAEMRLPPAAMGRLVELGWSVPEEGGIENFFFDTMPAAAQEAGVLIVATLREAYSVPHPAFLTAWGFDDDGPLDVSSLGVHRLVDSDEPDDSAGTAPPAGSADLRAQVLETLAKGMSVAPEEVNVDDDGDYPIRHGSAMLFVRPLPDLDVVSVFSPVLVDVEDTDLLRRRLDEFQARVPFVRFEWSEGVVTARVEVNAAPYQPEHLDSAIVLLMNVADEVDDVLQGDFGGRTFFQPPGSDAKSAGHDAPGLGGYI